MIRRIAGIGGARCARPTLLFARPTLLVAVALAYVAIGATVRGEDWPTYGHDVARSQTTAEPLRTPLAPCWVYQPRFPPVPAWGPSEGDSPIFAADTPLSQGKPLEPRKSGQSPADSRPERNRVDFDDAFQVAVAGGRVFFGSSADNKVYCLDAASGRVRWTKITGGPVRLGAALAGGRVYVGSDDGYVYCLLRGRRLGRLAVPRRAGGSPRAGKRTHDLALARADGRAG